MSDIFISYASADRVRVKPLVDALGKQGWSVWWDRAIPPGKTWDQVIEAALSDAHCVIVLWSRDSVQSDWVRTEADEARRRGILVPALIDDVVIPLAFRRIQAANLIGWSGGSSAEFDELVRAVAAVLSNAEGLAAEATARAQAASAPTAATSEEPRVERDESFQRADQEQVVMEPSAGAKVEQAPLVHQPKSVKTIRAQSGWRQSGSFQGHCNSVDSLAITDDGTKAASFSHHLFIGKDKTFRIWNVADCKELLQLRLNMDVDYRARATRCLAMSCDGSRVITSGWLAEVFYLDKIPVLKRALLDEPVKSDAYASSHIYDVVMFSDRASAVGAKYSTLQSWDLETGRTLKTFELDGEGYRGFKSSMAITADGRLVVVALKKDVGVFDLDRGKIIKRFRGHLKDVKCVAVSSDGHTAASGSDDKTIKMWDMESGAELRTLSGHSASVGLLAMNSSATIIASKILDNTVRVCDLENDRVWTLAYNKALTSIAMTPDASVILTGSSDHTVKVWQRE